MSTPASHIRVLSIDPTSRGFGFAVFEGSDRLIDWGVVRVRTGNQRLCINRIDRLIERYRPCTLVIEETRRESRRGPATRFASGLLDHQGTWSIALDKSVDSVDAQTLVARPHPYHSPVDQTITPFKYGKTETTAGGVNTQDSDV